MADEKELKLIPPNDPRVLTMIAPFNDDMLKEHNFKDRKELTEKMFDTMFKYGGIGLSANQVGLPYRMFVMGGHPQIEKGMKLSLFNPSIIESSEETVVMKEGCLTFPFVFLSITRPRKVTVEYEDENGDKKQAYFDGMFSRIFQHEYDHMLGRVFTEHASKFKLKMAYKKAEKEINKMKKRQELMSKAQ
jgi:peptide deformylase